MVELQSTASLFLSYTVKKLFPQCEILDSGVDRLGFFCEFTHTEKFHESLLLFLENEMKKNLGEEHEVILQEMVPQNAKELLLHRGQKKLAERTKEFEGLVQLAQIGDFYHFFKEPLAQINTSFVFSLVEFKQKKERVRVSGALFSHDRLLRKFLKKFRDYPQKNHFYLAKELDLYTLVEGKLFYHPHGQVLRELVVTKWRALLREEGFEEVGIPKEASTDYFKETGRKKLAFLSKEINEEDEEFLANEILTDQLFDFFEVGEEKEKMISSLQFIRKFSKIFDLECCYFLVPAKQRKQTDLLKQVLGEVGIEYQIDSSLGEKPGVYVLIADSIGRLWAGPKVEWHKGAIAFSLFGCLERFIALLIERYEGELPFWLSPEQVRLLSFEGVDSEPIQKILDGMQLRYRMDRKMTSLGEKIHQGLRMKVPYVMVFGKREEKENLVTVRAYSSNREQKMTKEQMNALLVKRKVEN